MTDQRIPPLLEKLFERMDDRLAGREALELEYKRASGGLPTSMWETVSAFANTSGGWIILGIDDEARDFSIEGVPQAPKVLQTFFNQMRNPQKISTEVCGASDAAIEQLGDKEIIVLRIPAAPRKQRPVHINRNPYRGTFVRRSSGDFQCTKPEVDRMMRDASEASADATILPKFGWDALDRETFARYRRRFQTAKPVHDWHRFSDEEFLWKLGGFRRDRETGAEGLTVAGLLMFGRPESIREWRTRHLFDVRQLPGDLRSAADWDDRYLWEGNLLGAFEAIYPRITAGLATPFRLEGGVRIEDTPARIALREALVNLLIHADYSEPESSLIFYSPEGFLLRNPGNSRVPLEELTFGRHSDPRNPDLVFMFRQIDLAEEAGSGIQRIISNWRSLGYIVPSIDVGADRYESTLHLRHVHLFTEDDRAWLGSFGEQWEEAEQLALLAARHEGEVDNAKLRSLTGQHPADATKVLRSLRDRGFLAMSGWGRGASYQLGLLASASLGQLSLTGLELAGGSAARLGSHSGNSAMSRASSTTSGSSSTTSGDSSTTTLTESPERPTAMLEDDPQAAERRQQLQAIAAQVHGQQRIPADHLSAIVLDLCSVQPLTLRDLMALLRRSSQRLRPILRSLEESGKIQPLYPQRHHPYQRYVSRQARRKEHDDSTRSHA